MGKKKHEEHENHERWIIPYADMVTLLFAFFVVLYSMSKTDAAKIKALSEAMSEAFLGSQSGKIKMELDIAGLKGQQQSARRFVVKRSITNEEVIEEIRKALDTQGFDVVFQDEASPIKLRIDERGVVISLSAGYLFEPDSTEIPPELYPVISIVSDVIKQSDRLISIEGHTDSLPVIGNRFYDNWDLSVLRATSMAKLLIDQFGVSPRRVTAMGYAHYKPVANNLTPAGRNQNRRVDIILLNASHFSDMLQDDLTPGIENSSINP